MQSIDARHAHALTRRDRHRRDRVPDLAVHEDFSFRIECGLRDSDLAEHSFASGRDAMLA